MKKENDKINKIIKTKMKNENGKYKNKYNNNSKY